MPDGRKESLSHCPNCPSSNCPKCPSRSSLGTGSEKEHMYQVLLCAIHCVFVCRGVCVLTLSLQVGTRNKPANLANTCPATRLCPRSDDLRGLRSQLSSLQSSGRRSVFSAGSKSYLLGSRGFSPLGLISQRKGEPQEKKGEGYEYFLHLPVVVVFFFNS